MLGFRISTTERARCLSGAIVVCLLLLASPAGRASTMDGIGFPDTVRFADDSLTLSGCGVREFLWEDLYAVGLYFPEPVTDARTALRSDMRKAARIEVLFDGELPDDLPENWRDHLKQTLQQDGLRVFRQIYRKLKHRDILMIGFSPEEGSIIELNGRRVAQRPGSDMIDAVLAQWLGDEPVSKNLRRLLLQGRC